jgi:glycosyltransferase involved in cell wall biosynthesis
MSLLPGPGAAPRVLRLASVFPVPDAALGATRYDPVGGMQNHTGQLCAELDRLGVPQTVLTAYRPGAARREPLGRYGQMHRVGVPTCRLRQGWGPAALAAVATLPGPYGLVHAHLGEDVAVLPVALAAARRWAAPLVVTVHLSPRHTLDGTGPRAAFLRVVGGAVETAVLRRAAAVLTLTDRLARLIGGNVPVHVVPSGFCAAAFTAEPTGGGGVLFVGRLHRQKGLDTLVRAMPALPPGTRVTLAGDGPERAALQRLAGGLGVADRLRVTGFVPHRAVPGLLAGADVVVLPSRYEELGTALVEAMAAGRPVVAAAVGGIPELVRDGVDGLLVPPGDPAALAAAVSRVLGDPALGARLGRSGRVRVAGYDWAALAGRVLAIYRSVLPAAAGPWLAVDGARRWRPDPGSVVPGGSAVGLAAPVPPGDGEPRP